MEDILNNFGGVYLDCDIKMFKSLTPLHMMYDFYAGLESFTHGCYCSNAVIGSVPNHPVLELCINYIKQNQSIKAHTLLLIDINLPLKNAKQQLQQAAEKEKLKLSKIILLSNAGTDKQKISYNTLDKLPNTTPPPYTLIIPSDLHFSEEEFLSR